jgi:two-component system, chemotaxis family, CheB/CheR fusion protein
MPESDRIPIVGVGASAGGVEALEGLFRAIPADSSLAYVVVTHLGPGHVSMLPEIIGRHTAMAVAPVRDGDAVAANHVYVLPPGATVTIEGGRLHLHDTNAGEHERNPIDIFFAALAEDQGARAIGVVLSGSGNDGTLGIKAIKEGGGLTLAQGTDGSSPRYPSMPDSAIASGLVDIVVPVEEMPAKLVEYAQSLGGLDALLVANDQEPERVAPARLAVCQILRKQIGYDFSGYKAATVLRRVHRRMQVLQLGTIEDYVERLRQDVDEAVLLFRDFLIGVTSFFRDREAFEALQRIVPRLFDGRGAADTVRIWVAGCSTGEEAYSIAILLREHMNTLHVIPTVQIFATDIDEAALAVARNGRYPAALLSDVSPERLKRFFTKDGESYAPTKDVRSLCVFSAHSVIRDPPFSRIDLVSCRNLLIYFGPELQNEAIPLFHYALRPGGYLFLGISENVTQHAELFAPVDKKHRLFQRREHSSTHVRVPLVMKGPRFASASGASGARTRATGPPLRAAVEARVIERFAPAHVLVNREGDVVHYSAGTGKYFEAPVGVPSSQLLAIARKGLRLELRGALHEAMETRRPVVREKVAVEVDDSLQFIRLVVEPFGGNQEDPLFLVLFADRAPPLSLEEAAASGRGTRDGDHTVEQLERELRDTRERLQSTIEEYDTAIEELRSSNEEMVSMNEELQSTNEEMETSREELQSVNEELQTVNLELSRKVEALDQANNDLRNLFESTQIATVFLDRELTIRSFTPAMTAIFNLIPGDKGRPLTDIVSQIDYPELYGDIAAIFDGREPRERRIQRSDGMIHYLARVLPYRTAERVLGGVVVTFIDVTNVVRGEEYRTLADELNHRVRNILTVVIALAGQTLAAAPDAKTGAKTFVARLRAMGRAYNLLSKKDWGDVPLHDVVTAELDPYLLTARKRVRVEGPSIQLTPKAALAVSFAVHELATNAAKYGALSTAGGDVDIAWSVSGEAGAQRLVLDWRERGGPPVVQPTRRGAGTQLIEGQIGHGLGGEVDIAFAPDGLHARLAFPLNRRTGTSQVPDS